MRSPILIFVAVVFCLSGTFASAADEASQELEFNYTLGVESVKGGQFVEAIQYLEKVLAIDAKNFRARYYLAYALAKQGREKKGLKLLEELLKERPGDFDVLLQAGIIQLEARRPKQALTYLTSAANQQPSRALAFYYRGLAEQQLKQYANSVQSFQRASSLDDSLKLSATYFNAISQQAMGNTSVAIEMLAEVKHLGGESSYAKQAEELIEKIESGAAGGDKQLTVGTSLGFQYDSNVILEPDSIEVSDEDDFRGIVVLSVLGNYAPFTASYAVYQSLHIELDDFNVQNHRVALEANFKGERQGKPINYGLRSITNYALLSNSLNYFSFSTALSPYVTRPITENYTVSLQGKFEVEDFRGQDSERDNFAYELAINHILSFYKGAVFTGIKNILAYEDGDAEYDIFRFATEGQTAFQLYGLSFDLQAGFFHEVYGRSLLRREDNRFFAGGNVGRPLSRRFTLRAGYQRSASMSNVAAFDYTRNIVSLNLSGSF